MSDLVEHLNELSRDPASPLAAERVRTLARREGALLPYAEAFSARGTALLAQGARVEAIQSWIESALVYDEDLEDKTTAASLYERILRVDPAHRRALFTLGLLYHDLARFSDLLDVYRRRLSLTGDNGEKSTLHFYIAEILSDRMADPAGAFQEVVKAARLVPQNLRIVSRLQQLGEATGNLDEVAVVLGDLTFHQDDPRIRAAMSLRLADLHLGPLHDTGRALAYFRAALMDSGGNPEIVAEIADIFRERPQLLALEEYLDDVSRDRRVGPHVIRLERELARMYERELSDPRRALFMLLRVVRHQPEDREVFQELLRLGSLVEELGVVERTYAAMAKTRKSAFFCRTIQARMREQKKTGVVNEARRDFVHERSHSVTATLDRTNEILQAAKSAGERDAGVRKAIALLLPVHEQHPNDLRVTDELVSCLSRMGDFAQAARVLETSARTMEGRPRADMLVRASRVLEEATTGRDMAKIRALLLEATEISPTHKAGVTALGHILDRGGEFQALSSLYERAADAFLTNAFVDRDSASGARAIEADRFYEAAKIVHRFRLRDPGAVRAIVEAQMRLDPTSNERRVERAHALMRLADSGATDREALLLEALSELLFVVERRPDDSRTLVQALELGRRDPRRFVRYWASDVGRVLLPDVDWPDVGGLVQKDARLSRTECTQLEAHDGERTFEVNGLYGPSFGIDGARLEPWRRSTRVSECVTKMATLFGLALPSMVEAANPPRCVQPGWIDRRAVLVLARDDPAEFSDAELRFSVAHALAMFRPEAAMFAGPSLGDVVQSGRTMLAPDGSVPQTSAADVRTAERWGLVASGSLFSAVAILSRQGRRDRRWLQPLLRFAISNAFIALGSRLFE